uniref:Uncharacterized protein n=1 Tax=Bicosoecida sp. CB-2014 TaxID=1486930 RepID=A0A7S1CKR4_9STRA
MSWADFVATSVNLAAASRAASCSPSESALLNSLSINGGLRQARRASRPGRTLRPDKRFPLASFVVKHAAAPDIVATACAARAYSTHMRRVTTWDRVRRRSTPSIVVTTRRL